ncbi:site-specific integrase [Paraburkholderia strydomiana]|uniref:tyrosine-type recombinase/integrase n=1 Tax=Paraburkholderia strydomiana TaxID=1245417 RepID=UPI0038BBE36C
MTTKIKIDSKTARDKLAPRREPYFVRLSAGVYCGFRRLDSGAGTWIGRRRNDAGKQEFNSFGQFDTFDAASKAVTEWANGLKSGVQHKSTTVSDACRLYVANRRSEKGAANANDAEGRFKRLVYGHRIGSIDLSKLRTLDVEKWRDEQSAMDDEAADEESEKRAKDSANRNLTALKAALNYAKKHRLVSTDIGWKEVNKHKQVGARRNGWLHAEERKRLLDAMQNDLRTLSLALLHIGARPGELANADAADFDRSAGVLNLTGKTGPRKVYLSSAALEFFAALTKDKIGNAPLLTQADGQRWTAPAWGVAFREAREAAKLPDAVLYCMRHTYISEAIARGLDVFTVAKLTGTSVAIIQSNYGAITDNITERLNQVSAFL